MNRKEKDEILNGIDWATCFDVQSIEEDFTDVVRMVEVDKKRFNNYNTNHLPFDTNNNICDCTAPQVDEDKICICGLPITIETDWTNDSGYSDVF